MTPSTISASAIGVPPSPVSERLRIERQVRYRAGRGRGGAGREVGAVIRTRDEKGAALGGIHFAVRSNGELLPPAILLLIRALQHVDYKTNPAGKARIHGLPSGMYELWAYRTASEGDRLAVNTDGSEPSLQLAVAQGTYEADLTFAK